MKDDKEVLSFDSFEVDDFMLNKTLINEDNVVDTFEEKDKEDSIETMEEITVPERPEIVPVEEVKTEKKKKEKKVKKERPRKTRSKKEINKTSSIIQLVFNTISILFILGCCIHYGTRLIKYYKVYHPKGENGEVVTLIARSLTEGAAYQTEEEGLYKLGGASVYKGEKVDNYFKFSNFLWRIISVNTDGTIELALNGNINALMFNNKITSFEKSDILSYLNTEFIKALDTEYLTKTSYCLDEVETLDNVACNTTNADSYIRLLGITEFVNSKVNNNSYLISEQEYWLYNTSSEKAWHTSEESITLSDSSEYYFVKPVIRLKNSNILLGGTGTIDDPYYIEKDKKELQVGKYVTLGEDKWVIYNTDEKTISLALVSNLPTVHKYSTLKNTYDITDTTSIAYYLNNSYLESLSYKDIINTTSWNTGKVKESYLDVESTKVDAKVGMLNIKDLKLTSDDMYYLLTPANDGYVYYYSDGIIPSKISLARNIKPVININRLKITDGKGTIESPYVLDLEAKKNKKKYNSFYSIRYTSRNMFLCYIWS